MKLASIYSNKDIVFPKIVFQRGVNVIFARVEDPKSRGKDSHNLGKSFLARVIDFTLLAGIGKDHPFKVNPALFEDFVFYLEIETVNGNYVTVRRSVKGRKSIKIHTCLERNKCLRGLSDSQWQYADLSIEAAVSLLDHLLDLSSLEPYSYRKGLGYLLRGQSDYSDIFRIEKFKRGADQYWKPFMAHILGFNESVVKEKYEIDSEIKALTRQQKIIEKEAGSKSEEYDAVRGEIEVRSNSIARLREKIDNFSFREIEAEINETVVSDIESSLSELNERRYLLNREIEEINKSLRYNIDVDMDQVVEIFNEVNITFPERLAHNYDELIAFNKRLSSGRTERLSDRKESLIQECLEIATQIEKLDKDRQKAFALLRQKETLEKYKELQKFLIIKEREVSDLRQSLSQLDKATTVQSNIEEKKQESSEKVQEIRTLIRSENEIYRSIRRLFSEYVEKVLNIQTVLAVNINSVGNLEFNVKTLDSGFIDRETSEGKGTSYRKIFCSCFDLSFLNVYSNQKFYRFVYHDGIFEGLDNRKKVNLLELVRKISRESDIQYILTVIDSDLPRNELDNKLFFSQDEIVRELSDRGDSGRLFKTQSF